MRSVFKTGSSSFSLQSICSGGRAALLSQILPLPFPGRCDNDAQVLELRLPAELLRDPVRRSDQHRRVASATRLDLFRNVEARDLTHRIDNLADRVTAAAAAE